MSPPSKEALDLAAYWGGIAAILALPFVIGAAFYAARQLSLARKAGSGATLIALNEAFRDCWHLFLTSGDAQLKRYHFGDLVNALESGCAVYRDRVFFGHSERVFRGYLVGVFRLIEGNAEARTILDAFIDTPETFENIVWFLGRYRREIDLPKTPAADA